MARLSDSQLSVLNLAAQSDSTAIESILAESGFHLLHLDGSRVVDQQSLLAAATRDLPGLAECRPHNWSSLGDCLTSMAFDLEQERIALLWTSAHHMLEGGLADLLVAADVLTAASRFCYSNEVTLVTFLLGDGPNFPPWGPALGAG